MKKTQAHRDFSSQLRAAMASNKIVIGKDGIHRSARTGEFMGSSFGNAIRVATGRQPMPADSDNSDE